MNIPAAYSESNERERRFFKTRKEAEDHAAELLAKREEFGAQAKSIRPSLAEAATKAEELLKPYGISILEAAQRVVEVEKRAEASCKVEEAANLFEATFETKGKRRQQEVRYIREFLVERFGDRVLSGLGGEEVQEALCERFPNPNTFNARLRDTGQFLRWAAKKPRQWCNAEEVEHFEKKDTGRKPKPKVLGPAECRKLLQVAEKHYKETVPAFALMLFMGIRPEEITKMTAEHITEDGVTVPDADELTGEGTKTGRRFIQMTPVMSAWLAAYPVGDTVAPANWQRKWCAVRRMAGWRVVADLLKGDEWKTDDSLPEWTPDVLRHTAATVAINAGKPLSTLIFEHGHSQGERTLKQYYFGRMTKKDALAILTIGPKGKKLPLLSAA